ncbi:MAG TPA: DNA-3-methyladenine glycosylase I [Mariniphaga sp.]|nr:DNA-3-methyladenine glycosylase I [Mariniphaga sp.]
MCIRCSWASTNSMIQYHDTEWGVPVHDDQKLFEFLILESFQAGLSWQIVLNKRDAFREAFHGFNPVAVSLMNDEDVSRLMRNPLIIRNRLKILAALNNAHCFLKIKETYGSFDHYIWSFINFQPILNSFSRMNEIPSKTVLSDEISKDLKKRGFKFLGSTVVYAHMQATGMTNDHLTTCFRYNEINDLHSGT